MTESLSSSVDAQTDRTESNQQNATPAAVAKRPAVRILGRGDGVVVEVSEVADSWTQVVEMLTDHLTQANGFFRGERIVLDLGAHGISQTDLQSLLGVLRDQEVSLRTLRTSNEDVHHLAQQLGLTVTLQVQPRLKPGKEDEPFSGPNWEVFLGERQAEETPAAKDGDAKDGGAVDDEAGDEGETTGQTAAESERASRPGVDTDNGAPAVAPAVESSVIKNEANPELLQRVSAPPYFYRGTLRSGQVFRHAGPVVVIGDVNPGAQVISGGDVYIWGRLRGVVHAGAMGDERAVVGALDFEPIQLRIAGYIAMTPKGDEHDPARWFWKRNAVGRPEVARVVQGRIVVDQWDVRLG